MKDSKVVAETPAHPAKLVAFAEFILAHVEDITRYWIGAVDRSAEVNASDDLTYRQLLDHLPQLCTQLANILKEPQADRSQDAAEHYARTHGEKRWQQGYGLEELIREICIIRNDFIGRWFDAFEEKSGELDRDAKRIAGCIVRRFFDDVIVGSAAQYVEEQQSLSRASEAALLAEKSRAEAAASARSKFLALVSHELRTPLTPVLLGASVLLGNESLPAEVRELARVITHNAKLEVAFIDDLLDAARLSRARQLPLNLGETDVGSCLNHAITASQPDFEAKHLALDVSLEATAPVINGDKARLQRAFATLLRNAGNVSADGGQVSIHTHDAGDSIEITVRDRGVQLGEEGVRSAFLPFEEERRQPFALEGLGVSRYICRAIVEAHGGTITARAAGEGGGAIFAVLLPRASARRSDAPATSR